MRFLITLIITLFCSQVFASGEFFIMPTQSLTQGVTYGSLGLNINQPCPKYSSLAYIGYFAAGDDVIYRVSPREYWFQVHQGAQYTFSSKVVVEGGYAYHSIQNLPGLSDDNGVYLKLSYKAW